MVAFKVLKMNAIAQSQIDIYINLIYVKYGDGSWKFVLWPDQTKLFWSRDAASVWRRKRETFDLKNTVHTVKHCGAGDLVQVHFIVEKKKIMLIF